MELCLVFVIREGFGRTQQGSRYNLENEFVEH